MAAADGHAVAFAFPEIEAVAGTDPTVPAGPSPVEVALAEADAIREAARRDGFDAGRAEGAASVADAVTALHAAAGEVLALRAGLAEQTEDAAVDLALRIADHVLQGALQARPELVVDVVRGALRRLVERVHVTVLVHPADLDLVRDAVPGLISQLGGIEHLEVQAERRVARGGAAVRTQEGEVDATLATKLERVRETLAERLAAARTPAVEVDMDAGATAAGTFDEPVDATVVADDVSGLGAEDAFGV